MSVPSTQDLIPPFDPTAYVVISGAQLLQFITGTTPFTDGGFVKVTTDIGTLAQVPDANTITKWQKYVWIRVQTSSSLAIAYIWNPNAGDNTDPSTGQNLLQWYTIASASLPAGSITTALIADGAVTDVKISSVNWSKIFGAPTFLQSGTVAGGDLSGTYPNPSLGTGVVTSSKIAANAVTGVAIQNGTIDATTKLISAGVTAQQILRMNAAGNAIEWATKLITQLVEPTGADGLKVVRVNAGGTAFEIVTVASLISSITFSITSAAINTFAAGNLVINSAHGLGQTPSFVDFRLQCFIDDTAATGYTVGDEINPSDVVVNRGGGGGNSVSILCGFNATNVFATINNTSLTTSKKASNATGTLTNANWKLICTARL